MEPLTPHDFYFAGPEVEAPHGYRPGGYHPVHLGDIYCQRYRVIHKLGFGTYSTVWLARDLQSTTQTRYVALKFTIAELTGRNSEIKIHRHLASQSGTHPGSDRVLALLDHFMVQGANGEHDVLVFQVVGPHLEAMFNEESTTIQQAIKSLMHQVALGTSFFHDCGVVHADLHKGNIVFEIPDLDGKSEEYAMMALGVPRCIPVITRDQLHQTESHPKYLVIPGSLVECVKQDDLRVKIIDFGEAFFSPEAPRNLRIPLQVRAPEAIFNHLSTLRRIELGVQVDVWSMGCLIYELATSDSLIGWYTHDEARALHELTTLLGPLPEEWVGPLGASYASGARDASFEQNVQSISEVDDPPGLATILQRVLVLDPLRRPSVSDLLDHPWFTGPTTPSGSVSE